MILLLDVGNTRVKWRLLRDRETVSGGARPRAELERITEDIAATGLPQQVWVCSVAGADFEENLARAVQSNWSVAPWFYRAQAETLGLRNSYADSRRMGADRWLAMVAAWRETCGAVCVVDAGSALTIDFVDAAGGHSGGYILPGLDSMESALLKDTDWVRFGEAPRDQMEPGTSTEAAVFNGLLLSQAGAVSLALSRFGRHSRTVFTGGNGALIRQALGGSGEHRDNLVLDGLFLVGRAQ